MVVTVLSKLISAVWAIINKILFTMDLSRTANDRKLYLCKWYFKGRAMK